MNIKRPLHRTRTLVFSLVIGTFGSLGFGDALNELQEAVPLSESEGESQCVMVFAKVGERFHFDLELEESHGTVEVEAGDNAIGETSSLPNGLVLDKENLALAGVPQRAGFHEFVLRESVAGRIRERVVLIDIQGHSFAAGATDYASYFAGGVR